MNTLETSIQEVARAITSTAAPLWIVAFGALSPFALTVIIIIQNFYFDKRNKEMQKTIYDNNVKLKLYESVLSIYNSYLEALYATVHLENVLKKEWVLPHNIFVCIVNMYEVRKKIYYVYNHSIILFSKKDKEIIDILKIIRDKFGELCDLTALYHDSGVYTGEIGPSLMQCIRHCTPEEATELQKKIKEFEELLSYENFDRYFEPYLSFEEFDKIK